MREICVEFMKNTGYILTTVVYLILTVGISMNSHYCDGHLLETYVYTTPECPFCEFGGMDMKGKNDDDCCEDETEFYVVTDFQKTLSKTILNSRIDILLYETGIIENTGFLQDTDSGFTFDDSSPPLNGDDLTTLYHRYTFYG